ncbi:MAG: LytS/YhcK type 5TM receptor domain-containing protein [Pseudomonadota bacterium]
MAALTLLAMLAPLIVKPGFILDARNTLVALAAVFGGPIVGLMAAVPAAAYRIALGGPGTWGAPYGLGVSMLLGWALHAWAAAADARSRYRSWPGSAPRSRSDLSRTSC